MLADSIERDGILAFVERWESIPLFASQSRLPTATRVALHAQRLSNNAIGLANSLRGAGTGVQPALHDQLHKLTIPVLLLAGELDAKFCLIAQQMARQFPDAQLCIAPDAGHTTHLEQPSGYAEAIRQFNETSGES